MLLSSGSHHWDLPEQRCSSVCAWLCVLLHLCFLTGLRPASSPWTSLEISGLQLNFFTILSSLCSASVGTMNLCPCQWGRWPARHAVTHSSQLTSLYWGTTSSYSILIAANTFFFSIKIPNLQPRWADLQNKGFFNSIDFLLCFTVPQEKITDKTSLFHPLIFEVKVCGVWFSFNHWIRLCDGYNTVLFFLDILKNIG